MKILLYIYAALFNPMPKAHESAYSKPSLFRENMWLVFQEQGLKAPNNILIMVSEWVFPGFLP